MCSPNVIRARKQKRMRWEGHVARFVEKINKYKVSVKESRRLIPLCMHENTILKQIEARIGCKNGVVSQYSD